MKTKLLAVLAALGMVASASAVKVNNNLSISGFIDGSYAVQETDAAKTQALEVDEVEINFNVNVGNVSGLVALDSALDGADNSDYGIEQAHFTYNINEAVSVTFGRYGAALGFEREDPAGLYTFSRAYKSSNFNLGDIDSNAVEGLTVAYAADAYSIAVSLENAVGDLSKETGDEAFERAQELLVNLGANLVNTYTIPLTAGQDLYNTFLAPDDERIVRETKSKDMLELFLNKSLSRLPGNFAISKKIEELSGGAIKAPRPRKPKSMRED